ncbi:MAG: bifunctional phosphopantothenoylcysteine decarboxylase/phosphopantothenate--cysteine ligase CoaBC [Candidatus Gastranaerophilales bacterium]|nr:bifunctional phosphopantothenoylcysteine decarboxylase/phosphopantothenate--cysteine ligase CoaBC [Candidatus Gastranaerophilales bacterium]
MLTGKNILVGITGAIAAYKVCELIRLFKKNNANVKVVVTPNALNFVTKTTLESLSQNPINIEQFDIKEYKPEHIALTDETDIFVIAPASANTIAKMTFGICDNLLTSTFCAYKKQVVIAPCMNTNMWENPAVQENIEILKKRGIKVVEPETGFLACGINGKGRLAEVETIYNKVKDCLVPEQILKGKKVVITAGGTKENIDAVRYIGNYSSGKMGIALADNAYKLGAEVILISTVDADKKYKVINVQTAQEMYEAVKQEFENAYTLIMAAAVSDYRVKNKSEQKIKKDGNSLIIELIENPDILQEMSKIKRDNQVVVGFCAESQNLLEFAKQKIAKKGCDFICANDISKKDIGFSSNDNELYIINKELDVYHIEKTDKQSAALKILENIYGKCK